MDLKNQARFYKWEEISVQTNKNNLIRKYLKTHRLLNSFCYTNGQKPIP